MTAAIITAEVPVAAEIIDGAGGLPELLRRAVGMVALTPDLPPGTRTAQLSELIFVTVPPGKTVVGSTYCKVHSAWTDTPPRTDPARAVTFAWLQLRVLGRGEVATDTSVETIHP